MLKKSELGCQYYISKYETARERRHFPLILSKMPFHEILIRDRTIYALFEWKGTNFIIVNAHLNVLGKNRAMREVEIIKISQNLQM